MKKMISTPKWDAELNTDVCTEYDNADLTLTLNLGFKQINPAGGAATGTYHDYGDATAPARKTIKWTPGAWDAWMAKFVKSAQAYWHGKFWLMNNFPEYEKAIKGVTYRPNIWCKLVINGADATIGTFHHTIEVVRLDKTENWFGSHSTLYDNLDIKPVKKNTNSKGRPIIQQAHVHEIGHLLGLGHVDIGKAHCPAVGNTNLGACYGVADDDMQTVMGSGMVLLPKFATPWRKAMIQLSTKGSILTLTDWEAEMKKQYPRTSTEAIAGRKITVKLKR